MPDVPTMAELGFKGHEAETITGLLVPAGTPAAIVKKLHAEAVRIMALPDVKQRIADLGADVIASSPQEFTAQIKERGHAVGQGDQGRQYRGELSALETRGWG